MQTKLELVLHLLVLTEAEHQLVLEALRARAARLRGLAADQDSPFVTESLRQTWRTEARRNGQLHAKLFREAIA